MAININHSTNLISASSGGVKGTQFVSEQYDAGNSSTAITINFNNGQNQKVTLTGNATFTLSNPVNGATYKLLLVQDGTGSRTVTWPTIKWSGGGAPTLSTAASREDIVTLYYNGSSYYGQASIDFR